LRRASLIFVMVTARKDGEPIRPERQAQRYR